MNQIDFFGCSFTEAPAFSNVPLIGEFDILKYAMHCQSTKPVSSFLEYDLLYNSVDDFHINNFAGGSFGNHVIKEVIKNRIKVLDKSKKNIAIVQLSAFLRNPASFENIFENQHSAIRKFVKEYPNWFDINPQSVRDDYFVDFDMETFYKTHIKNLEEIVDILTENYFDFYIHFGWDVTTKDFQRFFEKSDKLNVIGKWDYEFKLESTAYFENQNNYNRLNKKLKGSYGGMLEYSANKLEDKLRYVHITQDHHPSYFSNKIFYIEIIRPFILNILKLNKNYFELDEVLKFENFLAELLPKKESTDGRIYGEMQVEIVKFIRSSILKENE